MLGEIYQPVMVQSGKKIKDISPESGSWCQRFVYHAINSLSMQNNYSVSYISIPYFLSALPHVIDKVWRKRTKMSRLLNLLDECLHSNQLTGPALEFAQTLQNHRQEIEEKWAEGERKMLAGET